MKHIFNGRWRETDKAICMHVFTQTSQQTSTLSRWKWWTMAIYCAKWCNYLLISDVIQHCSFFLPLLLLLLLFFYTLAFYWDTAINTHPTANFFADCYFFFFLVWLCVQTLRFNYVLLLLYMQGRFWRLLASYEKFRIDARKKDVMPVWT